jgi:hypothetical protein
LFIIRDPDPNDFPKIEIQDMPSTKLSYLLHTIIIPIMIVIYFFQIGFNSEEVYQTVLYVSFILNPVTFTFLVFEFQN